MEYKLDTHKSTHTSGLGSAKINRYVQYGTPSTTRNVMARDKIIALLTSEQLIEYFLELYDTIESTPQSKISATIAKFVEKKIQYAHGTHSRGTTLSLMELNEMANLTKNQIQFALLDKLSIKISTMNADAQRDYPETSYSFTSEGVKITGTDIRAKAQEIADVTEPAYLSRRRAFFVKQLNSTDAITVRHAQREIDKIDERIEQIRLIHEERRAESASDDQAE